MKDEKIKEAFNKAKQDIFSLHSEIHSLKKEIEELKGLIMDSNRQTDTSTLRRINSAKNTLNSTHNVNSTHSSTDNYSLEASKKENSNTSSGNEGVSTDRQTDRQTDTSTRNKGVKVRLSQNSTHSSTDIDQLEKVKDFLDSLDTIKKDLRRKIKQLTNQELSVFTSIYQLEEQGFIVDYSLLSQNLSLTDSSIRDYVQRIVKKGLPLNKLRENNKKVLLSISPELKKIASIDTIFQLREN